MAFEFSDDFLRLLADHSNFCLFGSFLFDNEKQRLGVDVPTKTSNFWHYSKFLERTRALVVCNPYYRPTTGRLVIKTMNGLLPFWAGFYDRHLTQTSDSKSATTQTRDLFLTSLELAKKVDTLKANSGANKSDAENQLSDSSQSLLSALLARSKLVEDTVVS